MEVLLNCSEEGLHLPPFPVQVGDNACRQLEIVCEQFHCEIVLRVVYGYAPDGLGVLSGCLGACEPDDFVYQHLRVRLVGQVKLLDTLIKKVVLDAYDKEHIPAVPCFFTRFLTNSRGILLII